MEAEELLLETTDAQIGLEEEVQEKLEAKVGVEEEEEQEEEEEEEKEAE